jgi:hypothetical protein
MSRFLYISPLRVDGREFTEIDPVAMTPGNKLTAIIGEFGLI